MRKEGVLQAEIEMVVPFFDVDMMEVVWHGHYVKYFEEARCALLDKLGHNYRQMRDVTRNWAGQLRQLVEIVSPFTRHRGRIVEIIFVKFFNKRRVPAKQERSSKKLIHHGLTCTHRFRNTFQNQGRRKTTGLSRIRSR